MRLIIAILLTVASCSLPALAQQPRLALQVVTEQLDSPLFATSPVGDERLFVVEQTGRIRIVANGTLRDAPFLDLSDRVSGGGEQGLLGLAFHPRYAENGRFFVNYTDVKGDTQVVAYTASSDPDVADPASATPIIGIDQPYANHNGGWLGFGPDGYLYVGTGDGGSRGDPENRAQNADELLGKILRLDVDRASPYAIPPENPFASSGGRPEIFALGARNPWRMAFDGNDLYVADVGQNAFEEISVITTADAGANLGWKILEGEACYRAESCDSAGLVLPVHAYSHQSGGCSVTGGYVYRGKAIPEIAGQYFFADFCDPRIRSFAYADGRASDVTDWSEQLGRPGAITSFGLDGAGELYVTTIEGALLQLVHAQ